jgi:hypothetical protein
MAPGRYSYNAAAGDATATITQVFTGAGLDEHSHSNGSFAADPFDSSAWLTSAKTSTPGSRCPGSGGDGMFAWVIPLLTLTAMEVVLGIDNIIFIALVAGRLPAGQQATARRLGLGLALISRLLLLCALSWLLGLTRPSSRCRTSACPRTGCRRAETRSPGAT